MPSPVRLVNSAVVEVQEIYDKLLLRDEKSFRLALFSLQRYLRVRYHHSVTPVYDPEDSPRKRILQMSFSSVMAFVY